MWVCSWHRRLACAGSLESNGTGGTPVPRKTQALPSAVSKPTPLSAAEIDIAYSAAQCVVRTHERLAEFLKVGHTLPQIDAFVARTLEELSCRSCFLGYRVGRSPAFPSHACLSVNECVVHGTAGYYDKPMKPGDVLKIDIGVWHKGFIGDAAWTYVFKEMSPVVKRLTDCGKESLRRGVEKLHPKNAYLEWAREVQTVVEGPQGGGGTGLGYGFHLVRGLGGHGIGRKLHLPPYISNVVPSFPGEWPEATVKCQPGIVVAVEPMIAVGTGQTFQQGHQWPVFTRDGSLSVHYEHDVLITPEGPRVLTEGLEKLPDVVG